MNREIKFRAWDKIYKKMIYEYVDHDLTDWLKPFYPDGILMQFTGLKDKNGKDIYEGDIVKNRYCNMYGETESIEVVEWRNGYHFQNGGATMIKQELEVIGNIYENPELL